VQNSTPTGRRSFVAGALATALSANRVLGANDRIRIAGIGTGGRCQYLLELLTKLEGVEIVAVCDVYEPRRLQAKGRFATPDARDYADYRHVLERKDIDAVVIGTPDHWHVPITIAAVQSGKDVYCEKPVTHKLEEGAALISAVRSTGRVLQTGTQQRSWEHYKQAKEIVASGALGPVTFVRTYWYQNHIPSAGGAGPKVDTAKLDWKSFLGPASARDFDPDQYYNWRWYWDFGGGAMTDLFVHWIDVVHWFTGENMPSRATAVGTRAILKQRQTPDTMSAALSYPSAVVEFDSALLGYIEGGGILFRGPKGALRLHRSGFTHYNELPNYSENYEPPTAVTQVKTKGDGTVDHMRNWIECMRSRNTPSAGVEDAVAAARAGQVANIALRGTGVWSREI
jgi:predicted dehydrogenase